MTDRQPRTLAKTIWRSAISTLAAVGCACAVPPDAVAGGGPENVAVVVNTRSWASQTIANHFIQLRRIPAVNVIYLDWPESFELINVDVFRDRILRPVMTAIQSRGLGPQIDYIVYSSDFPYSIYAQADFQNQPLTQSNAAFGSLNGLTYLAGAVMTKSPQYLSFNINAYFRRAALSAEAGEPGATHAMRSSYGWGANGELVKAGGQHFIMSTLLGYTSGRGNSVREVVDYLRRSAGADGTRPKGTIYFLRNDDIRSKARDRGFYDVVEAIKSQGVSASIEDGQLPLRKRDVMGAMVGLRVIDWPATGSTILPGAICDHFTSYGGVMSDQDNGGQSPLTEFLRYGAAGASGTVYEPTSIPMKFPSPAMHLHYVRGCSLAEAFYQSVGGPYQLLIVGDPLCRPWANIPRVRVAGAEDGEKLKGTVALTPTATHPRGGSIAGFELLVDGLRVAGCRPNANLDLDTTRFPDGVHDVRVVAIEAGPIESQGRAILRVEFANMGRSVELTSPEGKTVRWGAPLKLTASSSGASFISVFHNSRVVGKIASAEGTVEIDPKSLGSGPVTLWALAQGNTPAERATSQPLELNVEPAAPLPPQKIPNIISMAEGLELALANKQTAVVTDTGAQNWLANAGVKAGEPFRMSGYFDVASDDVMQFQVRFEGDLRLLVDGVEQYQGKQATSAWQFVPVTLAKGKHKLSIEAVSSGALEMLIRFGGAGAQTVRGDRFKHY